MNRIKIVDEFLDKADWSKEVAATDLLGAEIHDVNEGHIGIHESSAMRQMTYRAFNFFTYLTHYPRETREFLQDEYPQLVESYLDPSQEIRETNYEQILGGSFVRKAFISDVADVFGEVEHPNFEDYQRYYLRPHRRLIRLNYDAFNMIAGPIHPGGKVVYRGSGSPVKVVDVVSKTNDAMDW